MPDLRHRLRTHDLGFLKIVGDLWGVDLNAPDARTALPKLTRQLLDPALVAEIVEALPDDARQALDALIRHSGWILWTRFTRNYGELRDVGPGKRDREKPYLDPISATEKLWYRGLIGRDFLQRDGALQECAYIPDDLLEMLPTVLPSETQPPGRAASSGETAHIFQVSDRILDHTCTLLAALRLEDPKRSPAIVHWHPPYAVVHALLASMKLISSSEQPVVEDARPFLELPRGEAISKLFQGWRESTFFNELHLMPDVICEGAWSNDPRKAREQIFALLSQIPEDTWWNLNSFVKTIFEHEPDFQRPAGDFDTWLIRDSNTGKSLKGIQHWDKVDGALVRYLITGPMHWFGLVDLTSPSEDAPVTAFRLSNWAEQLLLGQPLKNSPEEDQPIEVFSEGTVIANIHTSRLARYQIARFCLWLEETNSQYTYQITPASLSAAADQGLKIIHLETLLNKYADPPPPSLIKALHQWEQKGGQVTIHPCIILRVESPQILQALRESPAGRFVSDPLGPTAAIINTGSEEKISAALARLGYLSDIEFSDAPSSGHHPED